MRWQYLMSVGLARYMNFRYFLCFSFCLSFGSLNNYLASVLISYRNKPCVSSACATYAQHRCCFWAFEQHSRSSRMRFKSSWWALDLKYTWIGWARINHLQEPLNWTINSTCDWAMKHRMSPLRIWNEPDTVRSTQAKSVRNHCWGDAIISAARHAGRGRA